MQSGDVGEAILDRELLVGRKEEVEPCGVGRAEGRGVEPLCGGREVGRR